MMTIPVEVGRSPIHGQGVFARERIRAGTVIWQFHPSLEQRVDKTLLKYSEEAVWDFVTERGYLNDRNQWVLCVDEGQFLNFPLPGAQANTKLGGLQDGEYMLLAATDIEPGEEITVPPESDKDYQRKMEARQ